MIQLPAFTNPLGPLYLSLSFFNHIHLHIPYLPPSTHSSCPPSPPQPKQPSKQPSPSPALPTPPRLLLNPHPQKLPIPHLLHTRHPRLHLRLLPTKRHQRRHTRNLPTPTNPQQVSQNPSLPIQTSTHTTSTNKQSKITHRIPPRQIPTSRAINLHLHKPNPALFLANAVLLNRGPDQRRNGLAGGTPRGGPEGKERGAGSGGEEEEGVEVRGGADAGRRLIVGGGNEGEETVRTYEV